MLLAKQATMMRRGAEQLLQRGADAGFGRRGPGPVGIGAIRQERQDALVAERRQPIAVGQVAVNRHRVEFEIAAVEHQAGRRPHRQRQGIGNAVADANALDLELPQADAVPGTNEP
jgi:hypothetical protein